MSTMATDDYLYPYLVLRGLAFLTPVSPIRSSNKAHLLPMPHDLGCGLFNSDFLMGFNPDPPLGFHPLGPGWSLSYSSMADFLVLPFTLRIWCLMDLGSVLF